MSDSAVGQCVNVNVDDRDGAEESAEILHFCLLSEFLGMSKAFSSMPIAENIVAGA